MCVVGVGGGKKAIYSISNNDNFKYECERRGIHLTPDFQDGEKPSRYIRVNMLKGMKALSKREQYKIYVRESLTQPLMYV